MTPMMVAQTKTSVLSLTRVAALVTLGVLTASPAQAPSSPSASRIPGHRGKQSPRAAPASESGGTGTSLPVRSTVRPSSCICCKLNIARLPASVFGMRTTHNCAAGGPC